MTLTRVANFNGRTFVCDEALKGKKHAVRYKGEEEFYVSPAVFDLLESDIQAVAKNLIVQERPSRRTPRRRRASGEKR